MKIPEKLKRAVGPYDVSVTQKQHLVGDRRKRGELFPRSQEIVLDADLESTQKMATFWHEIIEIISNEYELDLSHPQISILDMGISQVIISLEGAYGKEIGE